MDDATACKQLRRMIAFIETEAKEKVQTLFAQANEEAEIEKEMLIRMGRKGIDDYYLEKERKCQSQYKGEISSLKNQARMNVLKFKAEKVDDILEESRDRLKELSENKYSQVFEDLVLQGLLQLLEPSVIIRCRKTDATLTNNLKPKLQSRYQRMCGKTTVINVDAEKFLSDESLGGVEIFSEDGGIKIVNTVESRLASIGYQMIPDIRGALYGANPNRKHND